MKPTSDTVNDHAARRGGVPYRTLAATVHSDEVDADSELRLPGSNPVATAPHTMRKMQTRFTHPHESAP
jgi:hypothetical protein